MTTFVSRAEAGLRPPTSAPASIVSEGTTGHWEGGGIWGGVIGSHDRCASIWRAIQAYHMDHQGWTDIAYNCGACPHDYLFEGRGPGKRSAANGTSTANGRSAVVCYLGGVGDPFPDAAKRAMLAAADYLDGALLWDHGDWFNTACAGPEIRPWINSGAPSPDPVPAPVPTPPEVGDMTPGHATLADGRILIFVVADDRSAWEHGRGTNGGWRAIGGLWTSGLDVTQKGDEITLFGRGTDGALWGLTIGADGALVPSTPGKPNPFSVGGHIFPPR